MSISTLANFFAVGDRHALASIPPAGAGCYYRFFADRAMLSSRVRYALSALAYLARHPTVARTTERIAAVTGAPMPTLSKILQVLSRAGMIHTLRGPRGGVRLACDAGSLTVLDIVNAIDSSSYRHLLRPDALGPCLYRRLQALLEIAEMVMSRTTIAELAGGEPQDVRSDEPSIDELLGRMVGSSSGSATDGPSRDKPARTNVNRLRAAGPRSEAARKRRGF
ncbi:MAG: Rrf2 family transcriptional regulator [Pirellulales bacterium]